LIEAAQERGVVARVIERERRHEPRLTDHLVDFWPQQRPDDEIGAVELRLQIRPRAAEPRRIVHTHVRRRVARVAQMRGHEAVADRESRRPLRRRQRQQQRNLRRKRRRTLCGQQVGQEAGGCGMGRVRLTPGQQRATQIRASARSKRREREPAVDDVVSRCSRQRRAVLAQPVPDHALIRENRRRVAEPDFTLHEHADRVDEPAEPEKRLAAHGGGVALCRLREPLQRGQHVERALRPTLGEL
jgi:hypothetical protein